MAVYKGLSHATQDLSFEMNSVEHRKAMNDIGIYNTTFDFIILKPIVSTESFFLLQKTINLIVPLCDNYNVVSLVDSNVSVTTKDTINVSSSKLTSEREDMDGENPSSPGVSLFTRHTLTSTTKPPDSTTHFVHNTSQIIFASLDSKNISMNKEIYDPEKNSIKDINGSYHQSDYNTTEFPEHIGNKSAILESPLTSPSTPNITGKYNTDTGYVYVNSDDFMDSNQGGIHIKYCHW